MSLQQEEQQFPCLDLSAAPQIKRQQFANIFHSFPSRLQDPRPPRLTRPRRPLDEAGRLIRQAQAHQPPAGRQRTRENCFFLKKTILWQNEFVFRPQVILNSMHRYQPRLHVCYQPRQPQQRPPPPPQQQQQETTQDFKTFIFPETQFTAVTAYQNHRVSAILIYAKIQV